MTVQFVTMPRSGHHLLVRLIQQVRPETTYCEFYQSADCCRSIPCRKNVDLQKSHDFKLKDPIDSTRRYIVQARDPCASIASHWDLLQSSGKVGSDTAKDFRRFAWQQAGHRRAFRRKWIDSRLPNTLVIRYEELIADPVAAVDRVHRFVWDLPAPAVRPGKIKPARELRSFRHYSGWFFALLRLRAGGG